MADGVGDGFTHPERLARDPRNPAPLPGSTQGQPIAGLHIQPGQAVGGSSGGFYVAKRVLPPGSQPPAIGGRSNDDWQWSNGAS